jgi:hypothetical protein
VRVRSAAKPWPPLEKRQSNRRFRSGNDLWAVSVASMERLAMYEDEWLTLYITPIFVVFISGLVLGALFSRAPRTQSTRAMACAAWPPGLVCVVVLGACHVSHR